MLSQLLLELDGVKTDAARPVLLLAASSRPEAIDPALLRPGRLELHVHVPLPDRAARAAVVSKLLSRLRCDSDALAAAGEVSAATEGRTMADLAGLVREAGMHALREEARAGAGLRGAAAVSLRCVHCCRADRGTNTAVQWQP